MHHGPIHSYSYNNIWMTLSVSTGDLLKAKCGAPVRVELVGSSGNLLTDTNYSNMEFEVRNGHTYTTMYIQKSELPHHL